ncbi:MAG: PucR family transcriptional regulator ligand-binding domain-containing protein [Clostridium sp.]|nr:PucR family transcriptional regulator ligand-binding domain-containing protein [Clostridium sp.]
MSVSIKKLYENAAVSYKMKLTAGKDGLHNLVNWVHIIEDENATHFLHGNELVFTAGIRNFSENWLIDFTKSLYEAGAKAFVVNLGPHIREISQDVIDFCEEKNFPLFTIPWETRMVDMTRDFCESIIQAERVEDTISSCIQNILFHVGDAQTQILQMERYGYLRDSSFCFICLKMDETHDEMYAQHIKQLARDAESVAKEINERFIYFEFQDMLILVLAEYVEEDVKHYMSRLLQSIKGRSYFDKIYFGVSAVKQGVYRQEENFHRALKCAKLALQLGEKVLYYEKIGIYQLLLAIDDSDVLKNFYSDFIGKVESYDEENGTDYLSFLKSYVHNDGSPQLIAKEQFIHRNTVNNNIKKVEAITGYDLNKIENKVRCVIGLQIRDLL